MEITVDATIVATRARVLDGMRDYLRVHPGSYDETHVAECDAILARFLDGITRAPDRTAGLDQVQTAVLALNELNARCGGELIETDQREDLCALILRAGALRGFHDAGDDVTEPWREW